MVTGTRGCDQSHLADWNIRNGHQQRRHTPASVVAGSLSSLKRGTSFWVYRANFLYKTYIL